MNFGSRGTFLNTGIPGTGLYSRSRLDSFPARPNSRPDKVQVKAEIRVEEDGTLAFLDSNGQPLNDYFINLAKRQSGARIRELLEDTAERINSETEAFGKIHHYTPSPNDTPTRARRKFEKESPIRQTPRPIGFLARLFGKRAEIEAENAQRFRAFEEEFARWEAVRKMFEEREDLASEKFDLALRTDAEFMQQTLEQSLQEIVWPRETLLSLEIRDAGTSVNLDVDLPEIEDLPRKMAKVPERGYKLSLKELKGKALQEHYARHVHGIGFRILGEVFATLPTVSSVALSAFTQRHDPTTGHQTDTYIYSVRVGREEWAKINFGNLASVDVVSCFERFELHRKASRNGSYEAVTPLDA